MPAHNPRRGEYLAALLAAQTLIENGGLLNVSERNRPKAACIRSWLLTIAERGALGPVDRAAAGDALAAMGDDRPGVGLRPDGLPDIDWCLVPAGEFMMGSKDDSLALFGKETPQHRVKLGAFRIGRFPITNAQYDAFVQDGGYTPKWRKCWTRDGWAWKGNREAPEKLGGVFDLPNHPVVMVSWYEAHAFCNWLGGKLNMAVGLPTEAQWEKAARGDAGRTYPWEGEQITPEHANYVATGLNSTSAVGIFPKGASPCGALDMSGNVWEWCETKWRDNYGIPEDSDPGGEGQRVLRGGSFDVGTGFVRCAVRGWGDPDFRVVNVGFRVVASPSHS